jgi:Tfp pilus assembly protein PilV
MQDRETSRLHIVESNRSRQHAVDSGQGPTDKGPVLSTSCFLLPTEKESLSTARSLLVTKKGLTLVEVMIAFLVLLFTSLALMQTALVSISANMQNVLRDEAVRVAEMRINDARSTAFDNITSNNLTVTRTLKSVSEPFVTTMTVSQLSGDIKQVDVTVTWTWKSVSYTHSASTIIRRTT